MFEIATDHINSLLFPRACLGCQTNQPRSRDGFACAECWAATHLFDGTEALCKKCGLMLGPTSPGHETNCWQCDGHHYDKVRACGIYSDGLSAAVVGLKTTPRLSHRAVRLLYDAFSIFDLGNADVIIPVPLSKRRLMERGFNQAEVIATTLSQLKDIPWDGKSLLRTTRSPIHRVGMDRKARDLSVKNAFTVARPKLIAGKTILLVDDVYTTGATVSYCAKALKKSGAARVDVLTLARAVMHR